MNRVCNFLVLLMVSFSVCAGARAETVGQLPKPTSYVSDLANVFDAASQQQMEDLCRQVDQKAHAQIAVVTVNNLGGETKEQFAQDLHHTWGIGKQDNRGVLMLFAISEHEYFISVGYGLEGILNDAKVGDIGRGMVPQLKDQQYGPAALSGVQQIADIIATDAKVTLDVPVRHTYRRQAVQDGNGGRGFGIGGLIFFLILFFLFFRGGRGGGGGGGGRGWMWFLLGSMLGGGGRGSRGGGFGGGGGGDGGGGFGGFGGGDSGGGGAGGKW